MANRGYRQDRCRYCGGRPSRDIFDPELIPDRVFRRPSDSSPAEQLFASSCPDDPDIRVCCDPYCVCREYDARYRDPYWPDFAHPRWLRCEMLYSRRLCEERNIRRR